MALVSLGIPSKNKHTCVFDHHNQIKRGVTFISFSLMLHHIIASAKQGFFYVKMFKYVKSHHNINRYVLFGQNNSRHALASQCPLNFTLISSFIYDIASLYDVL